MGQFYCVLEPFWGVSGPSWGHFGAVLGPFWARFGAMPSRIFQQLDPSNAAAGSFPSPEKPRSPERFTEVPPPSESGALGVRAARGAVFLSWPALGLFGGRFILQSRHHNWSKGECDVVCVLLLLFFLGLKTEGISRGDYEPLGKWAGF